MESPIGNTYVVSMTSPIVEEWCAWMTAQGLSKRTIDERRMLFIRLHKEPLDLTITDLLRELGRDDLSNSSRLTYLNHLRAFWSWAIKMEYTDVDITKKLPAPKAQRGLPRPVTPDELEAILDLPLRLKTRAMILLCSYQGLRIHEAAKFQAEDIDFQQNIVRVTGKGGVYAELPLAEAVREFARLMPREGYWFPSTTTVGPVKANSASDLVGKAMRRAGVTGGPHRLRHWFGTTLLERGVDVRVVQELMRHSNLSTTAIYTKVSDEKRAAAMALLAA